MVMEDRTIELPTDLDSCHSLIRELLNVADEESLLAERFEQILDEAVAGVQVSGKLDGPIFHKHNYIVIYF